MKKPRFYPALAVLALSLVPAARADKDRPSAKAAKTCAQAYLRRDLVSVQRSCRACLKDEPDNADCYSALRLAEGRRSAAKPAPAPAAPTEGQKRAQQHFLAGMIHFDKGELAKAAQEWKLCRELDPFNQDCSERVLRKAGEEASGQTRPAANIERLAKQQHLAGMIYFKKGDYVKAADAWLLCRQVDPANDECASGLARLRKMEALETIAPQ